MLSLREYGLGCDENQPCTRCVEEDRDCHYIGEPEFDDFVDTLGYKDSGGQSFQPQSKDDERSKEVYTGLGYGYG
jgi:hypothetical protein